MKLITEYEDPDSEGITRKYELPEIVSFGTRLGENSVKYYDLLTKKWISSGKFKEGDVGDYVNEYTNIDQFEIELVDSCSWTASQDRILEWLIREWGNLVPIIREKAFSLYKECWEEVFEMETEGCSDIDSLFYPEPKEQTCVEDLFILDGIYLSEESPNKIGICGNCTWESEHGFGIMIDTDGSVKVGDSEEGYRFDL